MINMRILQLSVSITSFAACCLGQTAMGIPASGEATKFNQESAGQRQKITTESVYRESSIHKDVVVFVGDTVIPQFVDGSSWQTSVTLVNLENHPTSFDVLFFRDDGTDLNVPVIGQGIVRGMHITLGTAGSTTFQTTGTSATLSSGWALLSKTTNDSVGMMAIFRQSNPGGQPQEAVVPSVNQFENHFVLLFDNSQSLTGIAIANPTINPVIIPVNIRNEQGQIVDRRQISLGPYSHTAFGLPATWPSTSGIRGAVEFLTSGFGVGALGLRFTGSAFTSISVLQNFSWTQ